MFDVSLAKPKKFQVQNWFTYFALKNIKLTIIYHSHLVNYLKLSVSFVPARWLSWLECHPVHQRVAGLIPGQGTCLGCRLHPWLGCMWEATNRCFSLASMFPSLPLFPAPSKNQWIYPQVRIKKKKPPSIF